MSSIQELYQSTLSDSEDQIDYKSLLLNISSGNILIIIDGLDEIESKLKDKFSIDDFITSLVELNDTYQNCTVIITSRPSKREITKQDEIEELKLHGFDNELIEKYLSKRFKGEPKKLHTAKSYLTEINSEEQATPLILRLISDLIDDDLNQIENGITEYFILTNPLDKVVAQIIKREIKKQTLKITIDQYFKILSDIVFDYNNLVLDSDLSELIELNFIDSNTEPSEENFKKIKISPLLTHHKGKYSLKHDALVLWIKSRELTNKINKNTDENHSGILRCLSKELYKGGPLIDEIIKYKQNDGTYERKLIARAARRLNEANISSSDKTTERKIISAAVRLNLSENNTDKGFNTEKLRELFSPAQDDLKYLSLFGDFYPFDLSEQKISSGYFDDYKDFGKCKFSEHTIFYNCTFIKTDTSALGKTSLSAGNFVNCNLCENLERHLSTQNENLERKTENIKNDLIKILKTGYRSNCFNWKSEKVYRQQCATLNIKTTLPRILDKLCTMGILIKESEKASSEIGYRVPAGKSHSVAKFITDDIVDNEIRMAITEFIEQ
ncbi:MAG: NACHT domain-containing protein [Pseudomonadales bacterium]